MDEIWRGGVDHILSVKAFRKLVSIWQSYGQKYGDTFLGYCV